MEWCDLQLYESLNFPASPSDNDLNDSNNTSLHMEQKHLLSGGEGPLKGGFLHISPSWAWLCRAGLSGDAGDTLLQIICLHNGRIFCNYDFKDILPKNQKYSISCVEELPISVGQSVLCGAAGPVVADGLSNCLLIVVLQDFHHQIEGNCVSETSNQNNYMCLYSPKLNSVLCTIQLPWSVKCVSWLKENTISSHSILRNFDGCIAIGTDNGILSFVDLRLSQLADAWQQWTNHLRPTPAKCIVVEYDIETSFCKIQSQFRLAHQQGLPFALQMDVGYQICGVECLLPIEPFNCLGVGLHDGRLVCLDLAKLLVLYVGSPPCNIGPCSLVKMDYMEPLDDPKVSFYICSLHHSGNSLYAFLYSFMFATTTSIDRKDGNEVLSNHHSFQTAILCLRMPLEANKCIPLRCQAIASIPGQDEDDAHCLCAISWYSFIHKRNKLLLFDLNQWYKDEMPVVVDASKSLNYLAGYICAEELSPPSRQDFMEQAAHGRTLDSWLHKETITHFHSIQRLEEHFYPNSLSFDFTLLHSSGISVYNWEGAQNKIINIMRNGDANIFLNVDPYLNELVQSRLIPMFVEEIDCTELDKMPQNCKYEILMSTALEHNCMNLLRDCAKSWMDGSFMGRLPFNLSLSLSVLTDWIMKQAISIKQRCNDLCKGVFQVDGYSLDYREQNEFAFLSHQMKLLSNLLEYILQIAKKYIPDQVFANLERLQVSLQMATNYQKIILWLINIGLLPHGILHNCPQGRSEGPSITPYPYIEMKDYYSTKRNNFYKIRKDLVNQKTGSCRLLYIDAALEHVCADTALYPQWKDCGDGPCLYPPKSVEGMLRVLLLPALTYEQQCSLLWYFFLDLHHFLAEEEAFKAVLDNIIKFPSVFKLPTTLTKTVQSFWNLDHEYLMSAVDDFMSPFNKNNEHPQWLVEIMVQVLLIQNAANLALRVMSGSSNVIAPTLKLNTMLDNGLLAEAFHFVRSTGDIKLLQLYFICCLQRGEFGVIRDLALNEHEGNVLQDLLKQSVMPVSKNLHFVYLLQRSKYLEAVSYMDELAKTKRATTCSNMTTTNNASTCFNITGHLNQMDTPNMMLSAFNSTLTPITQGLTDIYLKIRNKIKQKEVYQANPVPLSCQLIKQNANDLLGGVYHSSALSAHFATYYRGEMNEMMADADVSGPQNLQQVMNCNNAPFLRRPQTFGSIWDQKQSISYPTPHVIVEKRSHPDRINGPGKLRDEWTCPGFDSSSVPSKRRRLVPESTEEINDLLQESVASNTSTARNENKNASQLSYTNAEFLLQPLVAKSKSPLRGDETMAQSTSLDIPGILKESSVLLERENLNQGDSRRSIRFTLPESSNEQRKTTAAKATLPNVSETYWKQILTEEESSTGSSSPRSKFSLITADTELPRTPANKVGAAVVGDGREASPKSNSKLASTIFPKPRKPLHNVTVAECEAMEVNDLVSLSDEEEKEDGGSTASFGSTLKSTHSTVIEEEASCSIATAPTLAMEDVSEEEVMATAVISSVTEFVPAISSSVLGVGLHNPASQGNVQMPERSSVVGGWTNNIAAADTVSGVQESLFAAPMETLPSILSHEELLTTPGEMQREHMLQTTLSMSTLDVSSSMMQIPSSVQSSSVTMATGITDGSGRNVPSSSQTDSEKDIVSLSSTSCSGSDHSGATSSTASERAEQIFEDNADDTEEEEAMDEDDDEVQTSEEEDEDENFNILEIGAEEYFNVDEDSNSTESSLEEGNGMPTEIGPSSADSLMLVAEDAQSITQSSSQLDIIEIIDCSSDEQLTIGTSSGSCEHIVAPEEERFTSLSDTNQSLEYRDDTARAQDKTDTYIEREKTLSSASEVQSTPSTTSKNSGEDIEIVSGTVSRTTETVDIKDTDVIQEQAANTSDSKSIVANDESKEAETCETTTALILSPKALEVAEITANSSEVTKDTADVVETSTVNTARKELDLSFATDTITVSSPYSLRKRCTSVPIETKTLSFLSREKENRAINAAESPEGAVGRDSVAKGKLIRRAATIEPEEMSSPRYDSPSFRTRSRLRLSSLDLLETVVPSSAKSSSLDSPKRRRTISGSSTHQIAKLRNNKPLQQSSTPTVSKRAQRASSVEPRHSSRGYKKKPKLPDLVEEEREKSNGMEEPDKRDDSFARDKGETYSESRRQTRNQLMKNSECQPKREDKANDESKDATTKSIKKARSLTQLQQDERGVDSSNFSPLRRSRRNSATRSLTSSPSLRTRSKRDTDQDTDDANDAARIASSTESVNSTRTRSRRTIQHRRSLSPLLEETSTESTGERNKAQGSRPRKR